MSSIRKLFTEFFTETLKDFMFLLRCDMSRIWWFLGAPADICVLAPSLCWWMTGFKYDNVHHERGRCHCERHEGRLCWGPADRRHRRGLMCDLARMLEHICLPSFFCTIYIQNTLKSSSENRRKRVHWPAGEETLVRRWVFDQNSDTTLRSYSPFFSWNDLLFNQPRHLFTRINDFSIVLENWWGCFFLNQNIWIIVIE